MYAFSRPFVFKGQEFYITASVGIAVHPTDGQDSETLLQNADAAMYRVKNSGGNNYRVYSAQLNEYLPDRLAMGNRLRSALKREEFVLHYQPQLDMQDGKVIGLEALLRWNDPVEGMRSPADFIPAIEVDRAVLVAFDFKVERVHSGRTARFVGDVERRGPEPLTASLWLEVELVDEGVAAAIFQTEAERNGEIADDLPA